MVIKKLSDEEVKQLIEAYLDEGITECRWCFAIDLERIEGEEITRHLYADSLFISSFRHYYMLINTLVQALLCYQKALMSRVSNFTPLCLFRSASH